MITALHDSKKVADLEDWVEEFELSHLVGGDYDDAIFDAYADGGGRPQWAVIDRNFELVHVSRDQGAAHQAAVDAL